MRVHVQEWRNRPDKATQHLLDALGDENSARLEHGELGDLYVVNLDEFFSRGMVFVLSDRLGSFCTYILYPFEDNQALPDTDQFLNDMARIEVTPVSR